MRNSIFRDKIFIIAFIVSLASHAAILLKPSHFSFNSNDNPIEITYLEQKTSTDNPALSNSTSLKTETNKKSPALKVAKSYLDETEKLKAVKDKVVSEVRKKKIIIKESEDNLQFKEEALTQTPEFYDYYRYLRQRIRQAISYPQHFQEGEVLVNFTLCSDGTLKEISIVDKVSTDNAYLRYTAIQSVKDASPFNPFPKELTMKEMPFQIFISFEFLN